jgi:hypothetical protein
MWLPFQHLHEIAQAIQQHVGTVAGAAFTEQIQRIPAGAGGWRARPVL